MILTYASPMTWMAHAFLQLCEKYKESFCIGTYLMEPRISSEGLFCQDFTVIVQSQEMLSLIASRVVGYYKNTILTKSDKKNVHK